MDQRHLTARVGHPFADGGFLVEDAGQAQGRFERHRQGLADVRGGGRDQDVEIAVLGDPLFVFRVIVGKGAEIELDGDGSWSHPAGVPLWQSLSIPFRAAPIRTSDRGRTPGQFPCRRPCPCW